MTNQSHQSPVSLQSQRGVVIIVALFIVALVATLSYMMMARLERDTRRTSLLLRDTQAELYAQGSIAWGMDQLRNNWLQQKQNHLVDIMPMKAPSMRQNGYKITSTIEDMQARFNINNLTDANRQTDFTHLLRTVVPQMTEQQAQEITRATVDWLAPQNQHNQFTKYYLQLPVPYLPAHRMLTSSSELRLVKGITPAIYQALEPYIVALPTVTSVNVQTASMPVLVSLAPVMTAQTAQTILQLRGVTPFVTPQVFLNSDVIKNHPVSAEKITVASRYFLLQTNVEIENQQLVLYTLLERTATEGKVNVTILWQSKGIW